MNHYKIPSVLVAQYERAKAEIARISLRRDGRPRCQELIAHRTASSDYRSERNRSDYAGDGIFFQCRHPALVGDLCGLHARAAMRRNGAA